MYQDIDWYGYSICIFYMPYDKEWNEDKAMWMFIIGNPMPYDKEWNEDETIWMFIIGNLMSYITWRKRCL